MGPKLLERNEVRGLCLSNRKTPISREKMLLDFKNIQSSGYIYNVMPFTR